MIDLSSEPSLGSMVITRGAAWKYSYILPRGMEFPEDATAYVEVTDRSGAVLLQITGLLGEKLDRFNFVANHLEDIPAGSNWELFVTFSEPYGDGTAERTYKTRYGRVVRREASFPLKPVVADVFAQAMFEDPLDRSDVGPRWITKLGQIGMHPQTAPAPVSWAMASRSAEFFFPLTLFDTSAALWYAQANSDDISLDFSLLDGGAGITTIVVCSNYSMSNYMGVQFSDDGFGNKRVQPVTGTGPVTTTLQGSSANETIPNTGLDYNLSFASSTKKLTLKRGSTTLTSWIDSGNTIAHGLGHRYFGVAFRASFLSTGPRLYKWKANS